MDAERFEGLLSQLCDGRTERVRIRRLVGLISSFFLDTALQPAQVMEIYCAQMQRLDRAYAAAAGVTTDSTAQHTEALHRQEQESV